MVAKICFCMGQIRMFYFIYQIDPPCARKECQTTIWRSRCWTPESHTNNIFSSGNSLFSFCKSLWSETTNSHPVQSEVITSSGKKSGYLENILSLKSLYLENKKGSMLVITKHVNIQSRKHIRLRHYTKKRDIKYKQLAHTFQ